MKILIKQATIVDAQSPHNGRKVDILIRNGLIREIGKSIKADGAREFKAGNLHISAGWVDLGTQVGEPGFEHRETLASASEAAVSGGYTTLACFPNTDPAIHSKSEISFILRNSRDLPVDILPIGALSRDCKGVDIAEILDMRNSGAVAFSDGKHPVQDSGLLLRALHYVKKFNGLIIHSPYDNQVAPTGQMHEGIVSTSLGLKGIPTIAESLMVRRDVKILEYAESRLHFYGISAKESVQIVREAKKNKSNLTASCVALNLLKEDTALAEFNSGYKVLPPLRGTSDRKALVQGVKDGVIDIITSNHVPRDPEEKHREFAQSAFGSTGLETAFAAANTALESAVPLDKLIALFSTNPRLILGLEIPVIKEGNDADLTLFDPSMEWEVKIEELHSLSKNEALAGQKLKGRSLGIVKKGKLTV